MGNKGEDASQGSSEGPSFFERLSRAMSPEATTPEMLKKELMESIKREEELVETADKSLDSLTENLSNNSYPAFMRPFIRNTIGQLKAARRKAKDQVEKLKKELDDIEKETGDSVGGKEASAAKETKDFTNGKEASATKEAKDPSSGKEGAKKAAEDSSKGKETSSTAEGSASKGQSTGKSDYTNYMEKAKNMIMSGDVRLILLVYDREYFMCCSHP